MHCLSHTHKGAREVRGCGGVLHVILVMHHVVQITWHVAVLEGTIYPVLVRGYFCAWILICDPEESSVLLATPIREHVKFVGDVLHVTLLHVSFVPFIYRTSAPLRVHRCNHRQYSTLYGAIMGEVCTSVLFHFY